MATEEQYRNIFLPLRTFHIHIFFTFEFIVSAKQILAVEGKKNIRKKEIKFASCIEFHTFGFRDEIGEPCRCFLNSVIRNKKKGKQKKKKGKEASLHALHKQKRSSRMSVSFCNENSNKLTQK